MDTLKLYRNLLKFMYDQFNKGNNDSGHGELIQVLIENFERTSAENRIGDDAQDQIGAVSYLLKNGWINAVDISGRSISNARTAYVIGRMLPTEKGKNYLQQGSIEKANTIASVSGTFLGKFFKSILGR
jgi:hypothetical protein